LKGNVLPLLLLLLLFTHNFSRPRRTELRKTRPNSRSPPNSMGNMTKKILDKNYDDSSVTTAGLENLDSDNSCVSSWRSSGKKTFGRLQRRLMQSLRACRSQAAAHFHRRLYGGTGIRLLDRVFIKHNITLGQFHLLVPLLVCTTMSLYFTFSRPNTGESGNWAYYALIYSFLLAHKQASLFQLIGLSWEQLVGMHKIASFVAMALSLLHGYVAYTGHDYVPCRESETTTETNQTDSSLAPFCEDPDEYMNQSNRYLGELRLEDNPRFRHSLIGPDTDLWKFLWDGGRNISGSAMLTCLLTLLLLSSFRATLRNRCFDLWLASHIAAAGAILAYADKHRVQLFIVLVIWWGVDGLLRYGFGSLLRLPKTATMTLLTNNNGAKLKGDDLKNAIVELVFATKFHYEAGQYIRVAIIETGQPVMFHPMTISSAPYQDQVTVHFRPFGGWTNQLARMAAKKQHAERNQSSSTHDQEQPSTKTTSAGYKVHVLLEGPYGNLAMNLWGDAGRFPVVVLIAGGIGVTPISSLARQLLHEHNHVAGRQRQQICIVWAVRNMGLVETLPLLGPDSYNSPPKKSKSHDKKRTESLDGFYATLEPGPATVLKANIFMTSPKMKGVTVLVDEMGIDIVLKDHKTAAPPLSTTKTQDSPDNIDVPSTYVDKGYCSFHSGHPDVRAILEQLTSLVERDERVAVIACGPRSLVQSAKEACAELTCDSPTVFDFHEELFLF
jgi:ferredoxin-NADP reductase